MKCRKRLLNKDYYMLTEIVSKIRWKLPKLRTNVCHLTQAEQNLNILS
jgi:hypothetical protein